MGGRSFDLGLLGGLGVQFGRGQNEARSTHGLLRINTDDNEPNDRLNSRAFSVTIAHDEISGCHVPSCKRAARQAKNRFIVVRATPSMRRWPTRAMAPPTSAFAST